MQIIRLDSKGHTPVVTETVEETIQRLEEMMNQSVHTLLVEDPPGTEARRVDSPEALRQETLTPDAKLWIIPQLAGGGHAS